MKLTDYTIALLEDIEKRIDPETEEDFVAQYEKYWTGSCKDVVFWPMRKKVSEPGIQVRQFDTNDTLHDYELMLDMQLAGVSEALQGQTKALGMRANYGAGIMTSVFGAKIFEMPRDTNMLPITQSLNDSNAVRRILDAGMPELKKGFGNDVFNFGEFCAEVLQKYPKITKYVQIYHPDTQGSLDIAELLWGSDMFYEMYDDPDFVQDVLQLITNTYISFMDKWFQIFPSRSDLNVHWNVMMKGNIFLRDDSAMNLSPDLYSEFAMKWDEYLLEYYGGGCIHSCGRLDHYIDRLVQIKNLTGINLSQPHLNDMPKIYREAFSRDIKLVGLERSACEIYEQNTDAVKGMILGVDGDVL